MLHELRCCLHTHWAVLAASLSIGSSPSVISKDLSLWPASPLTIQPAPVRAPAAQNKMCISLQHPGHQLQHASAVQRVAVGEWCHNVVLRGNICVISDKRCSESCEATRCCRQTQDCLSCIWGVSTSCSVWKETETWVLHHNNYNYKLNFKTKREPSQISEGWRMHLNNNYEIPHCIQSKASQWNPPLAVMTGSKRVHASGYEEKAQECVIKKEHLNIVRKEQNKRPL